MINPLRLEIPHQLTTKRLMLRCPVPGDGAAIIPAILASLNELKLWMPWAIDAYTAADAEDWCRQAAAKRILGEDASYLIFHRQTQKHIGTIASFCKDRSVPRFEIGYWLATSDVGNGYMREALAAVTQTTAELFQARRIEIRTDADNQRSRRVAERSGYQLEGILRNECVDHTGRLRGTCVYATIR